MCCGSPRHVNVLGSIKCLLYTIYKIILVFICHFIYFNQTMRARPVTKDVKYRWHAHNVDIIAWVGYTKVGMPKPKILWCSSFKYGCRLSLISLCILSMSCNRMRACTFRCFNVYNRLSLVLAFSNSLWTFYIPLVGNVCCNRRYY